MNELKKILIVHNFYQIPGGEDTVVANEKKLLENKGHKVFLYNRNNLEIKEYSLFKKIFIPFSIIFNIRTYRDIKKIIRSEHIDLVHVHNTLVLVSPSVYYAAFRCGVPIVQTIHNFRLLCPGATFYRDGHICEDCVHKGLKCAIKHSCYRNNRLSTIACVISTWIHRSLGIYQKLNFICLTDFNKRKLLNLKQIKSDCVFVKPNFSDSVCNEIVPYEQREKRYIYAGRIDKLKGIVVLLEAWRQMGDSGPQLLICGTGPSESWCKEYIKENYLNNIQLLGYIPNDQLKMLMAHSLALVLPTQWYEGFPMIIVEAYSVGTPVIGSDIGNVGAIIENEVTGWKFKADSAEDLVRSVKLVRDISISVQAEYNKKYSSEYNYKCLNGIYEMCCGI